MTTKRLIKEVKRGLEEAYADREEIDRKINVMKRNLEALESSVEEKPTKKKTKRKKMIASSKR